MPLADKDEPLADNQDKTPSVLLFRFLSGLLF